MRCEPSQGSHFFHNVLSMQVAYLTLSSPEQTVAGRIAEVDLEWLEAQPAAHELSTARHIELVKPLQVYLDGRKGTGAIVKPGWPLEEPAANGGR